MCFSLLRILKKAFFHQKDTGNTIYVIRDLGKHKDIGTTAQNTKATIPAHGVLMVRLSKKTK